MKIHTRTVTLIDDIICKRTGTAVPRRYHLYNWLAHISCVILDPLLYPFGYYCNLDCLASEAALLRGVRQYRARRAIALQELTKPEGDT